MIKIISFDIGNTLIKPFNYNKDTIIKDDLLYSDVIDCLSSLKAIDYQLIVSSNIENIKQNTLKTLELDLWFDNEFYSCEIGYKKPDIRFFKYIEYKMSAKPNEIIHIGDNFFSDVRGAIASEWHSVWLYRNRKLNINNNKFTCINSLYQLLEVIKNYDK